MMGVKDYLLDSFALLRTSLFCLILKANFLLIFLLLEYVLFELFMMNKYYIFDICFCKFIMVQLLLYPQIVLAKILCVLHL
jgi:hypothetical protein